MHKTKEKIITTALDLFMNQGYEETSLALIIKKTKLSKGALYHHFSSKDEIANEALSYFFESLHKEALGIIASNKTAIEKFTTLCREKCTMNKGQELALFELFYHLRHSDLRSKLIIQNRANFTPIFESIIEQGIKEGSFKPILSPQNAIHCFFSLHEGGDFIPEKDFKDKEKMLAYKKDVQKAIGFLFGIEAY